jgi:hypothetical protein
MTTSEEQIARAIEALVRIAEDIKNEWRADREIQARGSIDSITNLVPVPGKSYVVLDQTFDTPISGCQRFNGTLYNLDGDKPVEVCGQLVSSRTCTDGE